MTESPNMTDHQSILRKIAGNLAALSGGVTLGRACGLLWLPYLTRRLDPSDLGIYILVGAVGAVLMIIAQWGSGAAALRLFARQDDDRSHWLSAFFTVRLVGAAVLGVGITAAHWITGDAHLLTWLLLLAAPGLAADMLRTPLNSWQLAHDRPLPAIVLDGGVQVATRVAGVIILELGGELDDLVAVMSAVRVSALPVAAWIWCSHEIRPALLDGRTHLLRFLRFAGPFGIVATLLAIDVRIDLFMLSMVPGQLGGTPVPPAVATGLYAVPLRIIGAVLLPLEPLRAALVPTFVRLVDEDRAEASRVRGWVSRILGALCAAPASILLISLAPLALAVAAPSTFHEALPTLQVLCLALAFRIVRIPDAAAASVHRRPLHLVAPAATTLVANVGLNLVLIPWASHLGAAIATALSSAIGCVVYRAVALRVVGPSAPSESAFPWWLAWSGAAAGVAYIAPSAWIALPAATVVYLVGITRSQRVNRDDLNRLSALVK